MEKETTNAVTPKEREDRRALSDMLYDAAINGVTERHERRDGDGNLIETMIITRKDWRLATDLLEKIS